MKILFLILFMTSFASGFSQQKNLILISKDKRESIKKWLLAVDSRLNMKELYTVPKDSIAFFLAKAKGIIIGGGEDVNPERYGKPEYEKVCGKPDNFRDSMEICMIKYAMENKIPLLAICRGLQILNVANGGTLIPDIPSFTHSKINHDSKSDSAHMIKVISHSWLNTELRVDSVMVNSRHHQAIEVLSKDFKVAAVAEDGVIESIESIDKKQFPFIMGVQWHPESLRNKFSMSLARLFIKKCNIH